MESTAFNWYQLHNAAGNPMHSIGIHCRMLHGFHCIQPGYIAPRCMQSTAFTWDDFTTLHGIQCIQSFRMISSAFNQDPFGHAAWNPLHSIGIHLATLHGIHSIQSGSIGPSCMQTTALTWDAFHTAAWSPVHSITLQ